MTQSNVALTALNQRVWYVEGGVYPTKAPVLLALGKVSTDPSQTIKRTGFARQQGCHAPCRQSKN